MSGAGKRKSMTEQIQDPGSWIQDPGSWIQFSRILDPGSWILHPGSRIQDPGSLDPGSWIHDPGSWICSVIDFLFPAPLSHRFYLCLEHLEQCLRPTGKRVWNRNVSRTSGTMSGNNVAQGSSPPSGQKFGGIYKMLPYLHFITS